VSYVRVLLAALAAGILIGASILLGFELFEDGDTERTAGVAATATPSPTPVPTATSTPLPTPTPFAVDAAAELAAARPEIEDALTGFPGDWGFHVIDLPSGAEMGINNEQNFYPASAGKIVVAIAVLRQVEQGIRDLDQIRDRFEQMILISSDEAADELDELVNESETRQVLTDSGASESASFPGWRQGFVNARDLALVWRALVQGQLLSSDMAGYLLDLTSQVQMDPEFETFPARFRQGYLYSQKAGYNIQSFPHTFVGAGYALSSDLAYGFVAVLILRTEESALDTHEQRTAVFPIIVSHLLPPE
jgi:Beta-lactamase enzyme family